MVSPFSAMDSQTIENEETDWSVYQKEIAHLSTELDFSQKTDESIRQKDRQMYIPTLGQTDRKKIPTSLFNVGLLPELKKALQKKGFRNHRIISHWKDIVGEDLARSVFPVQIVHRKGGKGTLRLKVTPAVAFRIHHMQSLIIDSVNTYFGEKCIERLCLEQSTDNAQNRFLPYQNAHNSAPPCPHIKQYLEHKTQNIAHTGLKEALIALGLSVLKSHDVNKG
jgi:hypothetical protein